MKGVIFTELLEMIEKEYGASCVNNSIEKLESKSNGVYTSVGNYDHSELVRLLQSISNETGVSHKILLFEYGKYLFHKFVEYYPAFFNEVKHPFDFLESVDKYIHVEVLKLYPQAELPSFSTNRISSNSMEMIYVSKRRMEDFAHGLIVQSLVYFQKKGGVVINPLAEDKVSFIIEINE